MTTGNLEDDLGPNFSSYNIWVNRSRTSLVSEQFNVETHIYSKIGALITTRIQISVKK